MDMTHTYMKETRLVAILRDIPKETYDLTKDKMPPRFARRAEHFYSEYKRVRKESYRSEVGAKSCLTHLKNLSRGNPAIAQMIIERSMANNWAGLFELKQTSGSRPQYGQRIGQIIQSEDEAKRQRMIEKLYNAGNDKPENNQYNDAND